MARSRNDRADRAQNAILRAVLAILLALPYRFRIEAMGVLAAYVIGPIAGWNRRVRDNLALVCPQLSPAEVSRLARAVPRNAGRTLMEIYSGAEFIARVNDTEMEGPGVAALEAARDAGRGVILVTGHFGNYDVPRAALFARGYPLGALYKPMSNRYFNAHYVAAMGRIGKPLFATDRRGISGMVRHLKAGGIIGLNIDVAISSGARLRFFGQTALTSTSAADWALKYDAALIPIYGLRKPDGSGFRILVLDEIAPDRPEAMIQQFNDGLEALVRQNMDQWFWIHRRWKQPQRNRAAATTGP